MNVPGQDYFMEDLPCRVEGKAPMLLSVTKPQPFTLNSGRKGMRMSYFLTREDSKNLIAGGTITGWHITATHIDTSGGRKEAVSPYLPEQDHHLSPRMFALVKGEILRALENEVSWPAAEDEPAEVDTEPVVLRAEDLVPINEDKGFSVQMVPTHELAL